MEVQSWFRSEEWQKSQNTSNVLHKRDTIKTTNNKQDVQNPCIVSTSRNPENDRKPYIKNRNNYKKLTYQHVPTTEFFCFPPELDPWRDLIIGCKTKGTRSG